MKFLVLNQSRPLAKDLPAFAQHKMPSCVAVNFLVLNEVIPLAENILIFVALVRPFSGVNFLVLSRLRSKEFPTFPALMRPFSQYELFYVE